MSKDKEIVQWLPDVSADEYEAATKFLSLLMEPAKVAKVVGKLKRAGVLEYRATDLFRASRVKLPKRDDRPCRKAIRKIKTGDSIAPVLLVRDVVHDSVIIADGYHRICAAFRIDPDVMVRCKIA